MSDLEDLLTTDDVAAMFRQPKATIYAFNSRGDGPPRMKIGRRVLYRRGDVMEWLRTRYVTTEPSRDAA